MSSLDSRRPADPSRPAIRLVTPITRWQIVPRPGAATKRTAHRSAGAVPRIAISTEPVGGRWTSRVPGRRITRPTRDRTWRRTLGTTAVTTTGQSVRRTTWVGKWITDSEEACLGRRCAAGSRRSGVVSAARARQEAVGSLWDNTNIHEQNECTTPKVIPNLGGGRSKSSRPRGGGGPPGGVLGLAPPGGGYGAYRSRGGGGGPPLSKRSYGSRAGGGGP